MVERSLLASLRGENPSNGSRQPPSRLTLTSRPSKKDEKPAGLPRDGFVFKGHPCFEFAPSIHRALVHGKPVATSVILPRVELVEQRGVLW